MGVSTWTDTQDQMILDGLKADQTYTQIATSLGVSKAMVSGRLYRLRKLRPDDVPEKRVQFIHKHRSRPRTGPMAKTLNIASAGQKTFERQARSNAKKATNLASVNGLKYTPKNDPAPFMTLERGQCSWCLDGDEDASATMMCCAAPVVDAKKREGDRRSTHCHYHYQLSLVPGK